MPPAGRDDAGHAHVPPTPLQTPASRVARLLSSLLTIPSPVKALFDKFPVQTYAPNPLPQRAPSASVLPSLYVFCSEQDAAAGRPSYNPACLKWQVGNAPAAL
jgi:metaxin